MPKRRRRVREVEARTEEGQEHKRSREPRDSESSEGDEEEEDASSGSEGEDCGHGGSFVAWLEREERGGDAGLRVGELHFTNVGQVCGPRDQEAGEYPANAYCVACELRRRPDEGEDGEDGEDEEGRCALFTFDGAFPFRVLPSACVVGVPLEPWEEEGDDDAENGSESGCLTYALDSHVKQCLLEDLRPLPPNWTLPTPADDSAVVRGVEAWWKAGEAKTGWDISQIPKGGFTTRQMLRGGGDDDDDAPDHNTLLRLYKDLCAFRPLSRNDELTRDAIEERFEWRTCLCTYLAWAVPNADALDAIASLRRPVLELGAGTGYWAHLLTTTRGVDVAAYDLADSQGGQKHRFRHAAVRDGGVEQASRTAHAGRVLFLCWPDIVGDSAADDADRGSFGADALRAYKGDAVVYVGELGPSSSLDEGPAGVGGVVRAAKGWGDPFPPGGSSASAAFQTELFAGFRLRKWVALPNWPPYNSHLTIWERKK